jgi:ribulose-bisphosphate carboxylase small chain
MWGLPMFGLADPAGAMQEVLACRAQYPDHYVRVTAYDASLGRQTTALSFIVNRPATEPGFRLDRQESTDRRIRYSLHPYAVDRPQGQRYGEGSFGQNGARDR